MKHILIVKLTSLGDLIHTFPSITDVNSLAGEVQIDWLVEENYKSLVRLHPGITNIFTAATRRWRREPSQFLPEFTALVKLMRRIKFDMVIDAQGLLKSAVITRLINEVRIGYDYHSITEPMASFAYNQKISVDFQCHAIDRTRRLFARALDYKLPSQLNYGLQNFKTACEADTTPYLVFLHGTTWASKRWPIVYWKKLASMAAESNYRIKLLWGNQDEYNTANAIAKSHGNIKVCEKMDLNQIASLLASSTAVIAVDTGLAHLACALNVPCLSLYGATDSKRTGTMGNQQCHIQAEFECSPCFRKNCNYTGATIIDPACFQQITPERVWVDLQSLIYSD